MQLIPGGVFCYDVDEDQEFLFISDSTPQMFGYTMEEFRTRFHNCFPEMVYAEDRQRVLQEITEQIQQGNHDYCMYRVEMADGSLKWIYDRGRVITDENGKRWFYVVIVEADELKAAEERRIEHEKQLVTELRGRADHDAMTGLLNRYAAAACIEKAIQKYSGGTLFLLDLDNFKLINDKKGYRCGNQLMNDIVVTMHRLVHPEEILARFGGDKFLIFIPGKYNGKKAEQRAEEMIEAIRETMDSDIEDAGCSIGITISGNKEISFDEMMTVAEQALYQAKSTGKGKYYIK